MANGELPSLQHLVHIRNFLVIFVFCVDVNPHQDYKSSTGHFRTSEITHVVTVKTLTLHLYNLTVTLSVFYREFYRSL